MYGSTSGEMPVPVSATDSLIHSPAFIAGKGGVAPSIDSKVLQRDLQVTSPRHSIPRIDGQIHDHLLDAGRIGVDRVGLGIVAKVNRDVLR